MKKYLPILLILVSACSKSFNELNLIDKNGLKLHPETQEPYTGEVYKGNILKGFYKEGKKDGVWTQYYEDGRTKRNRGEFLEGKKVGLWESWHDNGRKKWEGTLNDSIITGLTMSWNKYGIKVFEGSYINGKRHGKRHGKHVYWSDDGDKEKELFSPYSHNFLVK